MKKAMALILALTLLTACGGTGASKEPAAPAETAAPTAEPTQAPTPEPTAAPTDTPEPEDLNKVEWQGYVLHIDDRQPMTGKNWPISGASRSIDGKDPKPDASYVMIQLGCDDGVRDDDLIDDKVKTIRLVLPDGTEVSPFGFNWWGIGFDSKTGFYSAEIQEGFRLVFEIPEGTDIAAVKLTVGE